MVVKLTFRCTLMQVVIYLSFDFVNTNQGIDAEFKANGNVTVDDLGGSGSEIDVNII